MLLSTRLGHGHSIADAASSEGADVRLRGTLQHVATKLFNATGRRITHLGQDTRAAVAIEFALVALMLIMTILFIMTVGLILYCNQALDYATTRASRQIMTGAVQTSGMSQASFQALVCSYLPAAFTCANVIVNVQTATQAAQPGGYYAFVTSTQSGLIIPPLSNSSAQFSPGTASSYEYVQVIYPITFIPSILAQFLGGVPYQGANAYLAVSTSAFRNEQYI